MITPERAMEPDEWFTLENSSAMLHFLMKRKRRAPPSRRKIILFAAAIGHHICCYLNDPQAIRSLELAEELADGRAWCAECDALKQSLDTNMAYSAVARTVLCMGELTRIEELAEEAFRAEGIAWDRLFNLDPEDRPDSPGALLRELFGNPFKVGSPHSPPAIKPSWRTGTAVTLARTVYESRDFSAMPILADALQDAGCDNEDVLAHCRDPKATHVRGCWVVDLVLGKE